MTRVSIRFLMLEKIERELRILILIQPIKSPLKTQSYQICQQHRVQQNLSSKSIDLFTIFWAVATGSSRSFGANVQPADFSNLASVIKSASRTFQPTDFSPFFSHIFLSMSQWPELHHCKMQLHTARVQPHLRLNRPTWTRSSPPLAYTLARSCTRHAS